MSTYDEKSTFLKKIFLMNPEKGQSETDFLKKIRSSFMETFKNNPNLICNMSVEGLDVFNYYSSNLSSEQERRYFSKIFSSKEILSLLNVSSDQIFSLSKNINDHIVNNRDVENGLLSMRVKLIEKSINENNAHLLINDKYHGGNIFSDTMRNGMASFFIFKNSMNKKHISIKNVPDSYKSFSNIEKSYYATIRFLLKNKNSEMLEELLVDEKNEMKDVMIMASRDNKREKDQKIIEDVFSDLNNEKIKERPVKKMKRI